LLLAEAWYQLPGTSYGFRIVDFSLTEPTEILEKKLLLFKKRSDFFRWCFITQMAGACKSARKPAASDQLPAASGQMREASRHRTFES
jgi:hypothetical protein